MNLRQRYFLPLYGIGMAIALFLPTSGDCQSTNYLEKNVPDGIALLPPPPKAGSAEEAADLETVRTVFNARTEQEKDRAFKDSGLSFALFQPAIGSDFNLDHLPRTKALLQQVKKEIGIIIDIPKDHFQRKRPYQIDEHLSLGNPEPSFGYPSGHSTRGTVYSMLLADLFPDSKGPILEFGRTIGWDRVLIGKHFPTDIYAGRVLGQAIVKQLKDSPKFQADLTAARAEIKEAHAVTPALAK